MTLIVDALNRIARQCSVETPSSWLTTSDASAVELRDDFLLETVDDILDRVDLPSPIGKETDITGDGSVNYSLPSDFMRIKRNEFAVYDNLLDRPCIPITTDGEWTYQVDIGTAGVLRYYRVKGYDENWTIDFEDAPASGTTITVHYMSNLWMANSSGTAGSEFTDAADVLLLPRRLIEAGTVFRYRERKGLPFLAKYNEYEALLARTTNDRLGRKVINMGEREHVRWQDLIPAYIPDS